ncbi:MAG: 4-hydroxy-3-methylbut-2-enyl diphosphate reductase, partial [Pseudomonadales bacterium]|nr:4-hydroxy-3-methylbut-2-enyl diphosphate reductase [Pseudomonadales bacterium]
DSAQDIQHAWLEGKQCVGITAGASAPEVLVQQVINYLREQGADAPLEQAGTPETITFSMPKELRLVEQ